MNCFPEQLQPDLRRRGGRRVRREQVRQVLHRPRRVRVRRLPQGIRRIALREVRKAIGKQLHSLFLSLPKFPDVPTVTTATR